VINNLYINVDSQNQFLADKNLQVTVADMFAAGSDTTANVLNWTILYLTANPDVQEKLHQEIITVIGTKRSPTLSDRPK